MQLGLFGLNHITDPDELGDLAVHAEAADRGAVLMGEHMVYPTEQGLGLSSDYGPRPSLIALPFVAAGMAKLRLGTGIQRCVQARVGGDFGRPPGL